MPLAQLKATNPNALALRVTSIVAMLCCALWASLGAAHEVRPAIADIGVTDGELRLSVTLNGEAMGAGANLDGISNTDELDGASDIDELRTLSPDDLAAQLEDHMPEFIAGLDLRIDNEPAELSARSIDVEDVSNLELPRDTAVILTAPWPRGAAAYSLTWPVGMGALVLRQQGVDTPYTGFLNGGENSGPISSGSASGGWMSRIWAYFFGTP